MKTILILSDVFEAIRGGAERQIVELCKNIDKNRYRLLIACLSGCDQLLGEVVGYGVQTWSFKIKRIYSYFGISKGFEFMKLLRQENVGIVITYHFGSDIWGTIFGKFAGVPIVISNRRDVGFWRKWYHRIAYQCIKPLVDWVVVNSIAVKNTVIKEDRMPDTKIKLIHNGIDLSRFTQPDTGTVAKTEFALLPVVRCIGCIGNLRSVKGHQFLVEAALTLNRHYPDLHYFFIGSGELEGELKTQVNSLGLEQRVHFLGKRNDIPQLLSIMNVCVLPSLSEGFSNALLEYMAAGKPVIATAVGGNIDIIEHEKNGLLVPPKDAQALAQAITRLLEDKEFAERLGQAARKTVEENFDIKKKIREFEDFLEEVVSRKL